ncbi:MAG: APC family permease [Actinomycetaceae bacterium]|nr:APC family permease [Actinomycetaceae bacterium]
MIDYFDRARRLLVGRPMRSEALGQTLLPKRIALPVFASDALSSVAYAPDEIILMLSFAGLAATQFSPLIGVAVAVLLMIVVASYRQTVHAYPSGGGDYEVVTTNLGPTAGLMIASALLVDYVLTVAVSISSGAKYLASAMPSLAGYEVHVSLSVIAVLTLLNLRGMRESGRTFAFFTYLYLFAIVLMLVSGVFQSLTGKLGTAPTAQYDIIPDPAYQVGLVGVGGFFLVLRAFSSGCAALTGVEAISNGVPTFRKPKSKNAATTLLMLGTISACVMLTILYLARNTGVRYVENPAESLVLNGHPIGSNVQVDPVMSQLAATVFADAKPLFYLVAVVTGLILVLAANTAFNGFPQLAQILAHDSFLPHQLYNRGDRLSFSNGILALAGAASVLIIAFDAQVTRLIQLYIIGVFISFTLSQLGMIRHWNRELAVCTDGRRRLQMRHSRVINMFGFVMAGLVLLVVLVTKFTHGAWMALLFMLLIFLVMHRIRHHYESVAAELEVPDYVEAARLPSRVHAIVLLAKLHKPAMRAISYARATTPSSLELVTVDINEDDTKALLKQWKDADIPLPLTVLASPFRDITGPVLAHVRQVRRQSPRELVVVYIPEYLVARGIESILHNHSATRLRARLQYVPGVVLATVPWKLDGTKDPTKLVNKQIIAPESRTKNDRHH